jgi:hypothetical protein
MNRRDLLKGFWSLPFLPTLFIPEQIKSIFANTPKKITKLGELANVNAKEMSEYHKACLYKEHNEYRLKRIAPYPGTKPRNWTTEKLHQYLKEHNDRKQRS